MKKESTIAQPYLTRELPDGRFIHRFEFEVIKLWELPARELKEKGLVGLFPLLVLTRDGAKRDLVEEAITVLNPPGKEPKGELLALTYGFASLTFENEEDQEWLIWRFAMLDDILRETRAFQEMAREGHEAGLKEGLREGRVEGELQAHRQLLSEVIQERFPELAYLAREKVEATDDAELLRRVTVKISVARTSADAEQYLLAISRRDEKN